MSFSTASVMLPPNWWLDKVQLALALTSAVLVLETQAGPDGIPSMHYHVTILVYKWCEQIAEPLSVCFNMSLEEGYISSIPEVSLHFKTLV